MEKRSTKVNICNAGGTAKPGSKTYKITLPSSWIKKLGITQNDRQVQLSFDGEKITIFHHLSMKEFVSEKIAARHTVYAIRYFDQKQLCTLIYADFTDKTLQAENYTDNLVKTAFGKKRLLCWEDFENFLEERCMPRQRVGIQEYLESIDVAEYVPWEIIQKTQGRMAEDQQWIEIEALK